MALSTPIAGHLYPATISNVAAAYKHIYGCNSCFLYRNRFSCQDYMKIP